MGFFEKKVPALYFAAAIIFMMGVMFIFDVPSMFAHPAERVASWQETGILSAAEAMAAAGVEDTGAAVYVKRAAASQFDGPLFAAAMPIDSKEAWIDWMTAMTSNSPDFFDTRWQLANEFIATAELKRPEDVRAFLLTPREHFTRPANKGSEYADRWLPIGWGATITDPDVVAMMTTTLDIKSGDKVLEIGTGSGYQSAILSYLSRNVYTIEIIEPLFHETNKLYERLEESYPAYGTIYRKLGDGYYGWEEYAPFDKIIVTCSIDHIPPPLLRQLKVGGSMVLPLGPPGQQFIMEVRKTTGSDGKINLTRRDVYNGLSVNFIPFRNLKGSSYSQ
ncbi:MAG: protein-L-isoaspartate O-methyltransferase [Treponema sp.]|jgi:protein-L-isoaspartate(D-aspartate) O-methyltransferase|nr:protein-L-isoaspartate O-methyltransferase [Treponema sp.]